MVLCENIFNFVVLNVNKLLLIIKTKITIMKKLFIFLLVALFATQPIYAQDVASEARKEAKKQAKNAKRDGFELQGHGDMESVIARHLEKIISGKAEEIIGSRYGAKYRESAIGLAIEQAIREHIGLANSVIKGRIVTTIIDSDSYHATKFMADYERVLSGKLSGELRPSFILVRSDKQSKNWSAEAFYALDYEQAHRMHLDAIRYAAEQQGLWQMYGSIMTEWVTDLIRIMKK